MRQSHEGFEIIDVFESFVGIVIYGYWDIPEVEIWCSDMIQVRSLLRYQLFEDADIFSLGDFVPVSEHLQVVTEYKSDVG